MKSAPFVHLHLHTCFSLLDGACRVKDIMQTALEQNMPAVAITDHGVLYGAVDFYKAAREAGVKPIIGCETYVAKGSRLEKKTEGGKSSNHLVLLATNDTGYHNLVKLISAAHLEGFYYKPRIDKEILAEHSDGLIGLSACLNGEIAAHLAEDRLDAAVEVAGQYADIFGKGNFYLEVMDHRIPEQQQVNRLTKELAKRVDLPIVATNDVHYLKQEHAAAHEVLLALQTQTVMSDPKRMRYHTDQFYMKSGDEMAALFTEFPGACDRTLEVAERCNVEIEFGKLHFPTFETPEHIDQKRYLIQLAEEGISRCYDIEKPTHPKDSREQEVLDRFKLELKVIEKTGFINYFLVVWDFVHFARQQAIPVGPGRGSGGGSLIAYVLGITTIDPLQYDLIFERFLNPERVSPPDFDIDFCQARRGEVIEYVKDKYGRENVAQITTFGSLGAKTVIRDVGRALEIPYSKCDLLSKMVPDDPKIKLKTALEQSPEFKKAYETDPDCTRILDFGFVLEGLYRNPGMHAAGVVIGEKPLIEIIPLARDKSGEPVTQYTMEPLGEIGLLKMDFLGLKTLTVIQEAVALIKETTGRDVDIDVIPFDDAPTYELLNRGDTVGVFQLESSGMRDLIRRVRIDRIEDLIAMIALYRPGPMNMLDDYVDRKTGKAEATYDHALLKPILEETYGVMLYQEQVQKAANILAGYSLGEADILRRAMGKKKIEVMEKQRVKFVTGCAKTHKINDKLAGKIFDTMAKFAGYGFNKAHSAGYAIISYQTAFLKANYPAEFMSALLSCEIGNFDKLPFFMGEAAEMGMEILPPDVNESGVRFKPCGTTIRFGLSGIKNVGAGAAESIVAEREKAGPYSGLIDFCSRLDTQAANKKVIESLVRSGALDGTHMHRARLFDGIDFAMARVAETLRDRKSGQGSLFDLLSDENTGDAKAEDLPEREPWTEAELLASERELLGIYMSGHPLTQHVDLLKKYRLASVSTLRDLRDGTVTRLGGIVASAVKKVTKAKETMAIIQLEDLEGTVEVIVFPDTFRTYSGCISDDNAVLVCGEVSRREDTPKVYAAEIYPLSEAPRQFALRVGLHMPVSQMGDGKMEKVRDILKSHPGETEVMICLQFPSGEKVFVDTSNAYKVYPDKDLILELEHELGEKGVFVTPNPKACKNDRPARKKWPKSA